MLTCTYVYCEVISFFLLFMRDVIYIYNVDVSHEHWRAYYTRKHRSLFHGQLSLCKERSLGVLGVCLFVVVVVVVVFCWFFVFGDEAGFSVGFPARPVGSLGETKPIRLAARPTRSSYSVFLLGRPHRLFLWVGPGFPSGWLSGYQLADGPTRSSYSVAQVPISLGIWWPNPAQWKVKGFSWRYYTLILATRLRRDTHLAFRITVSPVPGNPWCVLVQLIRCYFLGGLNQNLEEMLAHYHLQLSTMPLNYMPAFKLNLRP